MTQTDPIAEARIIIEGFVHDDSSLVVAAAKAWLASNPESKPAAGVTEVLKALKTISVYKIEDEDKIWLSTPAGKVSVPLDSKIATALIYTGSVVLEATTVLASASAPNLQAAWAGLVTSAASAAPETIPAEWQPIETAPHNGTWILLWWPHWHHAPFTGYFNEGAQRWNAERFVSDDGVGPTRWMRLPAAPAVSQPPADTRETGNG